MASISNGEGGSSVRTKLNNTGLRKNNYAATAAPTANDDTGDGYEVGSIWQDVTNDRIYIAQDVTSTAAVWDELLTGGSTTDLWTQISSVDFSSAASTTFELVGIDDYSEIILVLDDVGGATALDLCMRLSTDGGSTFDSTTAHYLTTFDASTVGTSGITDRFELGSNTATNPQSVRVHVRFAGLSAVKTNLDSQQFKGAQIKFHGQYYQAEVTDALQVFCALGTTINTGKITAYGQLKQVAGGSGGIASVVQDTTPQLGGMLDVNGNALGDGTLELLKFSETASAVNEITITNAATGNGPQISATGDNTNIDLVLNAKGTGKVKVGSAEVLTDSSGDSLAEKATAIDADDILIFDSADSAAAKTTPVSQFSKKAVTVNAQTGTTYTLVLGDQSKLVTMSNGSANTLTIPANASVAFPTGTVIVVQQIGDGATTIEGATGVTVNGVSAGSGDISAKWGSASIIKTATDTWLAMGQIGTVA